MAGLTNNPNDALRRLLDDLGRRVRNMETSSRRPTLGGSALTAVTLITPNATNVPANLASVIFDSGGVVDTATDRFTAPLSGIYSFTAANPGFTATVGAGISIKFGVMKNGTPLAQGNYVEAFDPTVFIHIPTTFILELAGGDYVQFYGRTEGSPAAASLGNTFAITLTRLADTT